jgi:lysozyme family protein
MSVPQAILSFTLKWEGGYVNDPDDPGGATMKGVTQKTYDTYRKKAGKGTQPVRNISEEEINTIYEILYYLPCHADKVAFPASLALFDAAVNCGVKTAILMAQRAAKVDADGAWGPITQHAVESLTPEALRQGICAERRAYYKRIIARNPKLAKFAGGWENRVKALEAVIVG